MKGEYISYVFTLLNFISQVLFFSCSFHVLSFFPEKIASNTERANSKVSVNENSADDTVSETRYLLFFDP